MTTTIAIEPSAKPQDRLSIALRSIPEASCKDCKDVVLALRAGEKDFTDKDMGVLWRELFVASRMDVVEQLRLFPAWSNPLARFEEQPGDVKRMVPPIFVEMMRAPLDVPFAYWLGRAKDFVFQTNFKSALSALDLAQKRGASWNDVEEALGPKETSMLLSYVASVWVKNPKNPSTIETVETIIAPWVIAIPRAFDECTSATRREIEALRADFGSWTAASEHQKLQEIEAVLEKWAIDRSLVVEVQSKKTRSTKDRHKL